MTQRRACFEGLDSEQEFKTMESNPLEQDVEGVEALLEMDVSGDLMNLRLPAGEKPAVPLGADDLVAYYEKQLAATQLVHNRLLKQFNQLAEEKQALETSLTVQTAALQQQLVVAREKSELAYVQTEHAHRQMQETHEAVKEIVGAVTNLTELLDISDDTNELSRCFEVVERNTQRTFQSIATAHETAQTVLELQAQARDACQVSPLFTNASASTLRGTDMLKRLEEDVSRLRRDLGESKRREQELEEEMRAAHQLFSGLEAEVVSLQQDQAQAAAKLQLSQEELVAARDELMATQRALSAAQSPAASALTEGLTKLDAHLASMQSFLEGLAMPQPPGVPDAMGGGPLQLLEDRSDGRGILANSPAAREGGRASTENGIHLSQKAVLPRDHLRTATAKAFSLLRMVLRSSAAWARVEASAASLQLPTAISSHFSVCADHMPESYGGLAMQLHAVVAERDDLRSRAAHLESYIVRLEMEKARLFPERAGQVSMLAAAGAAASAVAISVSEAGTPTGSPMPSRTPSLFGATASASIECQDDCAPLAPGMHVAMGWEAAYVAVAAERRAAIRRAEYLEEESEALQKLLRQGRDDHNGILRFFEGLGIHGAGGQLRQRKPAPSAHLPATSAKAMVVVTGLPGTFPCAERATAESLTAPSSRTCSRHSRRSDDSALAANRVVEAGDEYFSEQGDLVRDLSHIYTRSSIALQSSCQSFASEAPLVPTRRFTDASEQHTFLLDPTEPLEELLPAAAVDDSLEFMRGDQDDAHLEGNRNARHSQPCSHEDPNMQQLLEEVEQLHGAVCSLLLSKTVAYTEIQIDSERRLAAQQAAHEAAMMKLQDQHLTEVDKLRALLGEYADLLASPPLALHRLDKSPHVSEDGDRSFQYDSDLLQHTISLEVKIIEMEENRQQMITNFEERFRQMQLDHQSQLTVLTSTLQQAEANRTSCYDAESCLQQQHAGGLQLQGAQHESLVPEVRKQNSIDGQDAESCAQLQVDKAADMGGHITDLYEREKLQSQGTLEQQLAELRAAMQQLEKLRVDEGKAADAELGAVRKLLVELHEQLVQQQGQHADAILDLQKLHEACLAEETSRMQTAVEVLQRSLEECKGELLLRDSLVLEIRGQLHQVQGEKEVEEHSLQSLLSTKAWMTDEIRSLQATLKETSAKLALAEMDLAATKAAGLVGSLEINGTHLQDAVEREASIELPTARILQPRYVSASPTNRSASEAHAKATSAALATEQLAVAAVQDGTADTQLEAVQVQREADPGSSLPVQNPFNSLESERTSLMMEMVVLQVEVDELRSKHRTLQAQLEAVADELAYAVIQASLAELQLEQLRLHRVGCAPRASSALALEMELSYVDGTPRVGHADVDVDVVESSSVAPNQMAIASSVAGGDLLLSVEMSDHLGMDGFTHVQQARQLYKELRTLTRALGEAMGSDVTAQSSVSREALWSAWEAAITAQDRAAGLALTLHHQCSHCSLAADCAAGACNKAKQPTDELDELARARESYRISCEIYAMLHTDAENINNQLWRWNVRLCEQLSAKEDELTRVQVAAAGTPQLAFEALLIKKEAYLQSLQSQLSDLQAGLQTAQSLLLSRDGQVTMLQDMLVQVSEQVNVFEDLMLRCEVLTAGLSGKLPGHEV